MFDFFTSLLPWLSFVILGIFVVGLFVDSLSSVKHFLGVDSK